MGLDISIIRRIPDYVKECVLETLQSKAEEIDARLRSEARFNNVSGNLLSSLGAGVYDHGKAFFKTSFATILNGSEGSSKGSQMIDALASRYSDCVALVIIAAMDYASRVEDIESKDVIASTAAWAEQQVRSWIDEAMEKAVKDISKWR